MKQNHSKILFVTVVILVIALLLVGGLFYTQTNFQRPKPVLAKQLSIQTQVCACPNLANDGTIYEWFFSLTNEGRTPIVAITATLNTSAATFVSQRGLGLRNHTYTLNTFLISGIAWGPLATNFVRNPPLPFVGPTIPLIFNETVSNGEELFQSPPYLLMGETLPVTITVTYSNGTLSNVAISAQVVIMP